MAAVGSTPIQLYYSTTASAVPSASNLVVGELALNARDGALYYKNSATGNVATLVPPGGTPAAAPTVQGTLFGYSNSTGTNTALGYNALSAVTTGTDNIVMGYGAGTSLTSANYSVFVGKSAGNNVTTAPNNTAIGYRALSSCFVGNGSANTAIGSTSLTGITCGSQNIGIGVCAGKNITQGNRNIVIGYNAAASSATVSNEITIGTSSYTSFRFFGDLKPGGTNAGTTGQVLTSAGPGVSPTWTSISAAAATPSAVGTVYASTPTTLSAGSTNLGYLAGCTSKTLSCSQSVFIGYHAGLGVSGNDNTAIGYRSMSSATTAIRNTAVGRATLLALTTGSQNTVMGYSAGNSLTDATFNVLIGSTAGIALTSNTANTIVGASAGAKVTTNCNVFVGYFAANCVTAGANNTIIGSSAGANPSCGAAKLTTGSNNTIIGYRASPSSATVSNEITIGNSSNTSLRFFGDLKPGGTNAGTTGQVLISQGSGVAPTWTTTVASASAIANTGGWAVTPSGTKLIFSYNGTNRASLDSSGNLIVTGTVTQNGTP